jgi:hypothetical protein
MVSRCQRCTFAVSVKSIQLGRKAQNMKQIMDDILHLPCIVFAQIGYSIGADVQVAYNRPIQLLLLLTVERM